MVDQLRRDDTDVLPIDTTTTSRRGRRSIVVLLSALGALVLAVPLVVIALLNRTDTPTSAVPPPGPAAVPPAPASPSPSRSTGPTVPLPGARPPTAPRVPDRYRVVALGFTGNVRAVNDRGDMVGGRVFAGTLTHPFLWRSGKLTDLGELKPTNDGSGEATDINNRGEIVGISNTESKTPPVRERAFIWRNGVMTALFSLDTESFASAINDRGQVVGSYAVGGVSHAFLWQNGVLTDLGPGTAVDINDRGQIAGGNARGPWIWYQARFTYLDQGTAQGTRIVAMNNSGWAVGYGWIERPDDMPDGRIYLWRSGQITDLGKIGFGFSELAGINDRGQILGETNRNDINDPIPFLWQHGQMIDLSQHGVPRRAWMMAIDDRGRLIATAVYDGQGQVVMYV
jgi:probable HAF family extracellular repeat protein